MWFVWFCCLGLVLNLITYYCKLFLHDMVFLLNYMCLYIDIYIKINTCIGLAYGMNVSVLVVKKRTVIEQ